MIQEQEFYDIIKNATPEFTGKFGFIQGTFGPFPKTNGMSSGANIEGFEVWKKMGDETHHTLIVNRVISIEDNIKSVIAFLLLDAKHNKLLFKENFIDAP